MAITSMAATPPRRSPLVGGWTRAELRDRYGEQGMLGWAKAPQRDPYRVEIRPLLVATIQRFPQRTIESNLSYSWNRVSARRLPAQR